MATDTSKVERHIRALGLAKECAALGARIRTMSHVSGLTHGQLTHLFFAARDSAPRGRPPDSPDWYYNANLVYRAEASIVVSLYRRILELGFSPAEALVSGYKHYQSVCHADPRISFDRAFDLASHMDGRWIARTPSFSLVTCPVCSSEYVTSVSVRLQPATNAECPFCKLADRYLLDPRIQQSFPAIGMPDLTAMQLGFMALTKHTGQD
jgi:hypothetical protein